MPGFEGEAIFESEELEKFVKELEKKFGSIRAGSRALAGIISGTVYRDIIKHFEAEEGPSGAWPEWSDLYEEHMRKIGKGGNNLLQDSGRLRQSFTPASYRPTGEGVLFYNNAKTKDGFPYAAAHDEGGERLPQREFMWLSDIAMEAIALQTMEWITTVEGVE